MSVAPGGASPAGTSHIHEEPHTDESNHYLPPVHEGDWQMALEDRTSVLAVRGDVENVNYKRRDTQTAVYTRSLRIHLAITESRPPRQSKRLLDSAGCNMKKRIPGHQY